jgi:hypothetical protein
MVGLKGYGFGTSSYGFWDFKTMEMGYGDFMDRRIVN